MTRASLAISAVLPCYEEAEHLPARVTDLFRALEPLANPFEILIVAAGAAGDGTPEVAASLAASAQGVRCILQPAGDPGYGRAVALGVAEAAYQYVLLMDADGQFDLRDLPRLCAGVAEASVVIGHRAPRADPWPRRLAGALNTAVVSLVLGLGPVRDVDCGFKLLERSQLGAAPLVSRTGVVNAEILFRARARGARLLQVPVTHMPRQGGRARFEMGQGRLAHLPRPGEALAMIRDLAALACQRIFGASPEEEHQ